MENFGSSYLPASHQATMVRAKGVPVDNIVPADAADLQRRKLALLADQNSAFAGKTSNADRIEAAIAMMLRSSQDAAATLQAAGAHAGAHAMTDVTGFGLAGHLAEMLVASDCDAVIDAGQLPRLEGALSRH